MESHTVSQYLKFLTYLSLLALSSTAFASPEAPVYKCWANNGKGKPFYTDNRAGQNCISLGLPAQKAAAPSTQLPDAVFAKSSFWYKPIPLDVKLDANTAALTREFVRQKVKYYDNVTINVSTYASPVYMPDSKVKAVKVGFNNCQNKSFVDQTFMKMMSSVPIPSYAMQAAGNDAEMTIYDRASDTIWELWKAGRDSQGNWSACWGGKMENASSNAGIFQKGYGTTATGLPFLGGQITADELARGEIKHAIGISMVEVAAFQIVSWPANRSDGYNPNNIPNRITEGQRFRLDPTINVDRLLMTKAGKTVAKAAQKYGFVVWDKAGSVSIRAQNSTSYTALGKPDPYPALFEQKPRYAVLNGFPWDKLQFLPLHYGKP